MEEGEEVGEKKRREERREKGKLKLISSLLSSRSNIESFREQEEQKDTLSCHCTHRG